MPGFALTLVGAGLALSVAAPKPHANLDRWWLGEAVGPADTRRLSSISFSDVGVPRSAEQNKVRMAQEVNVSDRVVYQGDAQDLEQNYHVVARSGEAFRAAHPYEGDTFGSILTTDRQPVYLIDPATGASTGEKFYSRNLDYSSLIHKSGRTYMVVHLEEVPGGTYFLELEQDRTTGLLRLSRSTYMDWSSQGGMWFPCAGLLSPWNTHLGSEEYEPDAKALSRAPDFATVHDKYSTVGGAQHFMRYHGVYPTGDLNTWKVAFDAHFHPYQKGWSFEAGPNEEGGYFNRKLLALGRRSGELPYVMPDRRTVYMTDDGQNVYMSMFYADVADDLSAGELFCGKATQTSASNGGSFTLEWISMGHAGEAELRDELVSTTFSDLFDDVAPLSSSFPATCPSGFTAVHGSVGLECLRLRAGNEMLASRLESRRYAALLGCTTEWNKMEGFTYSADTGKGYISMSTIEKAMEDRARKGQETDAYDAGTGNSIRLPYNGCGCVYEVEIDGAFRATGMAGLICGREGDGSDPDNRCATSSIANPDNVAAIQGHAALIIGEDTSGHRNNIMWKYDLETGLLQERVASTPTEAEVCGPYFYPDVAGFSYLTMVVQHPSGSYAPGPGVGYAVWPRQCSATYPGWSMPGDGSEGRCLAPMTSALRGGGAPPAP